jgi:hypothetical protein
MIGMDWLPLACGLGCCICVLASVYIWPVAAERIEGPSGILCLGSLLGAVTGNGIASLALGVGSVCLLLTSRLRWLVSVEILLVVSFVFVLALHWGKMGDAWLITGCILGVFLGEVYRRRRNRATPSRSSEPQT